MNMIHFSPNRQNRTPDIVNALLQVQSDTVISFEKGVYDFYKEGAYSDFFTIGCNRNGTKHVIFPILNRKNIVIEGNGSLFLFHDRVFPFIVQHCQNITLKNFQVDFSFPRCLEGEVTRLCEDGFELTIDTESCQYSVNESGNFLIQAGSDLFSTSERRIFLEQKVWHCFLVAGEYYYETDNWPADTIFCNAIKTEKGVFFSTSPRAKKWNFSWARS